MTEKEKIRKYLTFKSISESEFYRKTGLSNGFLNSGKGISSDKLKIIISIYRDINLNWLLFGNENMIIESNYNNRVESQNLINESEQNYNSINTYLEKNIKDKDLQIIELSKEIGKLKEQLKNSE